MKTIAEIRLENLEALIKELGTQDKVAEAAGTSSVYLSQIKNKAADAKTGKLRQMGDDMARKIEIGCGKEVGWMDNNHAPAEYEHVPDGFYMEHANTLGDGGSKEDDIALMQQVSDGDKVLFYKWVAEANQFFKWKERQATTSTIVSEDVVKYFPDRKADKLTEELLELFSQLDTPSKREYLANLRGFVAGRRPHDVGNAPAVAEK